jgi:hypothetical protein
MKPSSTPSLSALPSAPTYAGMSVVAAQLSPGWRPLELYRPMQLLSAEIVPESFAEWSGRSTTPIALTSR